MRPATEPVRRSVAGFTLIEIMISLLLLAVGLLGVEALGVYASRMTARAEKQTYWMGIAADTMERTVSYIREGTLTVAPPVARYTIPGGDTVRLEVGNSTIANSGGSQVWTVQVSVYPNRRGTLLQRADSIGMTSSVVR
ncbi:MAG TPA: prepilin-type N-terminal cleavage/methylation domain-containing protein [Longimicrobiaceae bacterium]|nr:prepilin-type N-terminal cleavage/methylation domain-containing protein [Longimicrobiaceae bacterium]